MEPEPHDASGRRPLLVLAAGAAAGMIMAAWGLIGPGASGGTALPAGIVARVNGVSIAAADYERVLAALAQDRRNQLQPGDRTLVLNRLIDEELLVQRGLDLGFAQHDGKVRKDLSTAVIDSVVAEYADLQPGDDELEAYYRTHLDFFTRPGRLRLRQVWVRTPPGADTAALQARASEAARRLRAGEDFASVRATLGDAEISPVPDTLLPVGKLSDYLGPTVVRSVLGQPAGTITEPTRSGTGFHVLEVIEVEQDSAPPFAEIKSQVANEMRRREAESALRRYLDDLRERADVAVVETLP
ncbi:peptidylprolyl isomerase [Candidatus Binatia bacterium]|nr:peptidylprolyl isomerase [Candidatus Binatia bacterium]